MRGAHGAIGAFLVLQLLRPRAFRAIEARCARGLGSSAQTRALVANEPGRAQANRAVALLPIIANATAACVKARARRVGPRGHTFSDQCTSLLDSHPSGAFQVDGLGLLVAPEARGAWVGKLGGSLVRLPKLMVLCVFCRFS